MKILIVDDERDIGFILGLELQNLGHETVVFSCVLEALEYLQSGTADAILCDLQMPKISGIEFFKTLQQQDRDIPFYILTGEPVMETKELLKSGVKDVLFKPQDLLRLSSIFK